MPRTPTLPAPQRGEAHVPRVLSERTYLFALCAAIALGAIVRGVHILGGDFPLNDGGLFYAMAQDLQANSYVLPAFTSYNQAEIPFGYSPLGFYVAALLDDTTPFSLMDTFRLLPWLYTTGTIAAFALLAKRLLHAPIAVIAATFAFALIPRSFIWLLMGGGITRGLGLMCALLALHQVHRLYTEHQRRSLVIAAVLSACTVLAHAETGWFLAFSVFLFWVAYGRTRESFIHSAVLAGIAVLLTAPWWLTVVAHHGIGPFVAATATGGNVLSGGGVTKEALLSLLRITATSEPFFPLLGALGLVGVLAALRSKHYALPAWWVAIILLDVRAYPTFTSVPVALLAGMAVHQIVLPLSNLIWDRPPRFSSDARGQGSMGELFDDWTSNGWHLGAWPRVTCGAVAVLGVVLLFATFGSLLRSPGHAGEAQDLVALSHDQRDALAWIEENTARTSKFLLIPHAAWQTNKESEWFPVLAGRESVATVQGTEWTPAFEDVVDAYDGAWECGFRTADCLSRWSFETGLSFTHVYVPADPRGQCCSTLLDGLRRSPFYLLIYDGPGGTIFARA